MMLTILFVKAMALIAVLVYIDFFAATRKRVDSWDDFNSYALYLITSFPGAIVSAWVLCHKFGG